eukprot:364398-Chlamydomonas_euryale.AAC.22
MKPTPGPHQYRDELSIMHKVDSCYRWLVVTCGRRAAACCRAPHSTHAPHSTGHRRATCCCCCCRRVPSTRSPTPGCPVVQCAPRAAAAAAVRHSPGRPKPGCPMRCRRRSAETARPSKHAQRHAPPPTTSAQDG